MDLARSKRMRLHNPCRLPVGEARIRSYYGDYKRTSKHNDRVFEITLDEFKELALSDCHYCGVPPCRPYKPSKIKFNGHLMVNGIDRKDSSIGYVRGNCVPCCTDCNSAKMKMGYEQFRAHIVRIYHHFASGAF
jgi:hypothetical protein